jgi:hypothetical protein
MRGGTGIMHELRKERSTVDHASSSAQVNSSQLHHNHQSSHLAIALDTSHTSTLVGLGVWEIDFHVGHAYSYRMFRPDRLCQLDIVWLAYRFFLDMGICSYLLQCLEYAGARLQASQWYSNLRVSTVLDIGCICISSRICLHEAQIYKS